MLPSITTNAATYYQSPESLAPLSGLAAPAPFVRLTDQVSLSQPFGSQSEGISPHHQQQLGHIAKAGGLLLGTLLLKKLPAQKSSFRLFSSDWKEWAKVLLAIGSIGQAQKAANWKPPVWLNAMMNVAIVTPLITRFNTRNILQGVIIAPLVGGLAGLNHYVSDKAEKPFEEYLHIPPLATRLIFSALTTLTGLGFLPTVAKAIPQPAKSWPGQSAANKGSASGHTATRAGVSTMCANGCCASIVCANDLGQMGSAVLDSYQTHQREGGQR